LVPGGSGNTADLQSYHHAYSQSLLGYKSCNEMKMIDYRHGEN